MKSSLQNKKQDKDDSGRMKSSLRNKRAGLGWIRPDEIIPTEQKTVKSLWISPSIQRPPFLLYFKQQVHIYVPFLYPDLLYWLRPSQILLTLIFIPLIERSLCIKQSHSILFCRGRKDLIVFGFWSDSCLTFQVKTTRNTTDSLWSLCGKETPWRKRQETK